MNAPRTCVAEGCEAVIPAEARSDRKTCSIACRKAIHFAKTAPDRPEPKVRPKVKCRPKAPKACRCGGHAFEDADGDIRCLKCGRTTVAPEDLTPKVERLAILALLEVTA